MNHSTKAVRMANQVFNNMEGFEALFREHYSRLCGYALRFVRDSIEAEEIVQDLFYKLWERRDDISINSSVKSYLFSAVHNRCLKYIEHQAVENKYRNYYLNHESEIDLDGNESAALSELQQAIERTLNALPERCRKIFRLNRFEGLKYNEIARELSISVKTVEANMGKALKLLRKSLKDYVEMG